MHKLSRTFWVIAGVLVLLALVGSGAFLFWKFKIRNNETKVDGIDPVKIVQEVGRHIELPKDEQPSIAIVRDVKKLQDQEIFRKARNGDVLLIYLQAKRAYLYDPVGGRLVDVAPVNLQNESVLPSSSPGI